MKKEELLKKYQITDRHDIWTPDVDNHMSIEIFRIMHDGRTPMEDDNAVKWVIDFLDKTMDKDISFMDELKKRHDWGVLLLTARRMVFNYADDLLEELNTTESE